MDSGGGAEVSRECVLHHHACACREAKFAELRVERDKFIQANIEVANINASLLVEVERLRDVLLEAFTDWCDDHFDEAYPYRSEWAEKAASALALPLLEKGEKE